MIIYRRDVSWTEVSAVAILLCLIFGMSLVFYLNDNHIDKREAFMICLVIIVLLCSPLLAFWSFITDKLYGKTPYIILEKGGITLPNNTFLAWYDVKQVKVVQDKLISVRFMLEPGKRTFFKRSHSISTAMLPMKLKPFLGLLSDYFDGPITTRYFFKQLYFERNGDNGGRWRNAR